MSTEQHLNKLFETARHAEPLLSAEDIELQLKVKGIHTPKRFKLFNLKTVLFMSALIILLFSLFYWLPNQKTEQVSVPKQGVEKSTGKKNISEPILASVNTTKATPAFIKTNRVSANLLANPFTSPDPQLFPTQYPKIYAEPKAIKEGEKPYLILTHEELRSLHIYTDGNTLMYINTKDSSLFTSKKLQDIPNHFYLHVDFSGGSVTYSSSTDKKVDNSQLLELKPALIEKVITNVVKNKYTTRKVGYVESFIGDPSGFLCVKQHFIDLVKSQFIPIKLSLIAKDSKYGKTDHDMIFWYEPTREFLNLLPANKPIWVNNIVSQYNSKLFYATLKRLQEDKVLIHKGTTIDSVTINALLLNRLKLNNNELTKLGFFTDGKSFRYENKCGENNYLGIYNGKTVYHRYRVSFVKKLQYTKLPFYPLFSSGYPFEGVYLILNDYKIPADLTEYSQIEQAQLLFNRMKDNLIPVEISLPKAKTGSSTEIFWFEPTPEFLTALPKDKLPLTKSEPKTPVAIDRSIDLRSIKVIELTAEELQKLGVGVNDKTVFVTSNLKLGKQVLTVAYNKAGSSFNVMIKQLPDAGFVPKGVSIAGPDKAISFEDVPPSDSGRGPLSYMPSEVKISVVAGSDNAISFSKNKAGQTQVDSLALYPNFSLITDDLGQKWRMYEMDDSLSGKEGERKLIEKIGGYIPILVRSGDINNKDDDKNNLWRADIIIWYEPSELLFNTLPPRIANELRAEYQSIFVQKENKGASCKYFEACKNKPGAIVSYTIFPNPTDDDLQIEFTLSKARSISANLYTVNGQLVKNILNQKSFESGTNKQATHINDLAPGIYLLVIESDKGDIISQRIVRK